MLRLALKSVRHRPLRLVLTLVSIALGISFISGSFIFTNSIKTAFDDLFDDIYSGTDIAVVPEGPLNVSVEMGGQLAGFPASVEDDVAEVKGVAHVEGSVGGQTILFTEEGDLVAFAGAPVIVSHQSFVDQFNTTILVDGRYPTNASQIALDLDTIDRVGLKFGDNVYIAEDEGRVGYTLVGSVSFGPDNAMLGAVLALFEISEAQRVVGLEGQFSRLSVAISESVDIETVVGGINEILPEGVNALTQEEQQNAELEAIGSDLDFVNTFILVFAYIAVFVGAFVIYNTFRVIVAQRNRETGLLRAIGARPSQVIGSILIEAIVVALVATAVGMGLGFLVARGIGVLFASGGEIPTGDQSLTVAAVVTSLVTGLVVTVLSALIPAIRASRTSPMAALRDSASEAHKPLKGLTIAGAITAGLGGLMIGVGLWVGVPLPALFVGIGALLTFVGVFLMSAQIVVPVAAAIRKPLTAISGAAGKLAASNLKREARRTASTSAALMVGVSIVTLVATFAASINDTVDDFLRDSFPADFIVQSKQSFADPFATIPSGTAEAVKEVDGVEVVTRYGVIEGEVDGVYDFLAVIESETADQVIDLKATPEFGSVGGGIFVLKSYIGERHEIGDFVEIEGPTGTAEFEIIGTVADGANGNYIIDYSRASLLDNELGDNGLMVRIELDQTIEDIRPAIEDALQEFPTAEALSLSDLADVFRGFLNTFVLVLTGLLAFALVIAIVGITNTLLLSVNERTREIGLIRAVGFKRFSIGSMITWESVVTALFGAVVGMVLGVLLAWALVTSLRDQGFTGFAIPWVNIGIYTAGAIFFGIVAALWPAIHAARLNILEAIATE